MQKNTKDCIKPQLKSNPNSVTRKKFDALITKNFLKYRNMVKKMVKKHNNKIYDPDDILQECIVYLYNKPDAYLKRIIPYLDVYIYGMMKHSITSKTSPFQQKYNTSKLEELSNKQLCIPEEDDECTNDYKNISHEDIVAFIEKEVSKNAAGLYVQHIYHKMTYREMSEKSGYTIHTLYKMFAHIKQTIKTRFKIEDYTNEKELA